MCQKYVVIWLTDRVYMFKGGMYTYQNSLEVPNFVFYYTTFNTIQNVFVAEHSRFAGHTVEQAALC